MNTSRLVLVALMCVLAHAPSAAASVVIDTTVGWGGQAVFGWGEGDASATIGQTFTVTSDNRLDRFRFFIDDTLDPDAVDFAAYVMKWSGARATGPVLFQSSGITTTNNGGIGGYEGITIETGGLVLEAGAQYVAFFSASSFLDGVPGRAFAGYAPGNPYAGGTFVYINNGANLSLLTSQDWVTDFPSPPSDLAFVMEFNVPEPGASSIVALGLFGLRRRRGRA